MGRDVVELIAVAGDLFSPTASAENVLEEGEQESRRATRSAKCQDKPEEPQPSESHPPPAPAPRRRPSSPMPTPAQGAEPAQPKDAPSPQDLTTHISTPRLQSSSSSQRAEDSSSGPQPVVNSTQKGKLAETLPELPPSPGSLAIVTSWIPMSLPPSSAYVIKLGEHFY
eukprot:764266-Hanusia_phi.AAC.7